ncbi:MAG TPA: ABC transporter ATP-binding protein [Acidimicrobiia bacterium]|nr:ABC transporter ATP-binding protein [Acidimicrobiia bacterium]
MTDLDPLAEPAAPISTGAVIRRAFREVPILGQRLWLILLMNAAGTLIQVLVPVLVQQTVDRDLTETGVDVPAVMVKVGLAAVVLVIGAFAAREAMVRLARQAAAGLSQLRVKVFSKLISGSVLHVQSERRGALVSRVTSDISTVQEFTEWGGVVFIVNATQVLIAIVAMVVYEWRLALLVVVAVILYAFVLLWFQKILQRNYDRVREVVADSLAVMGETVTGLPEVRAYGIETTTMERVRAALERRSRIEFRTAAFGNGLFSTAEIFAASLTAGVVAAGLLLGAGEGVSAGVLIAFLFLVNLLIEPVQSLVEILDFAQNAASGLRRVVGALDRPDDIPEPIDPVPLPGGMLGVELRDVRFRYPTGADVLSDVSVTIEPGRRVAVVGETGSGKTTFAKLLVRMLDPVEGEVRIGGVDLRRVASSDLRRRVAFVPQEGFLFEGTVADNVRYGSPHAGGREVRAAFLELGLDGWVQSLPDGLESQVGERGGNLSAGERQLVALVRAWISAPDVLLLDEATSAVDPALDVQLRRAIDRLTAGRTSITIAHRLATAEAADEVIVFDDGRLVERGPHDELVKAGGTYAGLYEDWVAGTMAG